ncbi:MAG: hypothetical protein R3324_02735 [Halobacteriales archaeon]|nr:hypothetical protein [Halobacteriales archaeon]
MDRSVATRILFILVLGGLLGGQMVHYATSDNASPYPEAEALDRDYDRYVGQLFYGWTDVVASTADGLVVETGDVRLTVRDTTVAARPGDVLQVYGTLAPDRSVVPHRLVVSTQSHLRYLYGISLVAALLTAGLGLRHWRFDRETLAFVPREDDARA